MACLINNLSLVIIFAIAMRIKGGELRAYAPWLPGAWFAALIVSAFVNPVFGMAWFLGNRPDIGDVARDWKRGVQRGVFTGACLTLVTLNPLFLIAGASFGLYYPLSVKRYDDWSYAEMAWGATLGLAHVIWPLILPEFLLLF